MSLAGDYWRQFVFQMAHEFERACGNNYGQTFCLTDDHLRLEESFQMPLATFNCSNVSSRFVGILFTPLNEARAH
jgi:hypothetical protein